MKNLLFVIFVTFSSSLFAGTVEEGLAAADAGNFGQSYSILLPLAEEGDPRAQYVVGILLKHGWGVNKDIPLAFEYYKKAAAQGLVGAIFDIGYSYQSGDAGEQNYSKAAEWYEKAATLGHPVAMYGLAGLYLNGLGVEKDIELARAWYQRSSDAGYEEATKFLEEHFNEFASKKAIIFVPECSGVKPRLFSLPLLLI